MTGKGQANLEADFSIIRYAQCWEDADVLLQALDVQPGDHCLSIASAGDNALAMLARSPARVVALDLSPAQLACLQLRVAAYRELAHGELLELLGLAPSQQRPALYRRCRGLLPGDFRQFWDKRPEDVAAGVGQVGKLERYLATFRRCLLPLIHPRSRVEALLESRPREAREDFYSRQWDTRRWRLLFRLFFSRFAMGRLGRDPSFFNHVEGTVADRIMTRCRHALTHLDPSRNPYLQWILLGEDLRVLPFALRPENFDAIRRNLPALEVRHESVDDFLTRQTSDSFDSFNLSDIFEYVPLDAYHGALRQLARVGRPGARLAYWNLLVPRQRPSTMADQLHPLIDLSRRLHSRDAAHFTVSSALCDVPSSRSPSISRFAPGPVLAP